MTIVEEVIVRWILLETSIKLVDARCRFCKSMQYIFCLDILRKSYQGRTSEYARLNKMMNEAERHLKRFFLNDRSHVLIPGARSVNWCFHMLWRSKSTEQWCIKSCYVRRHPTHFLKSVQSLFSCWLLTYRVLCLQHVWNLSSIYIYHLFDLRQLLCMILCRECSLRILYLKSSIISELNW